MLSGLKIGTGTWSPFSLPIEKSSRRVQVFCPFELLYGRTVRGPMTILRELWTKEQSSAEIRTTYQYILDLRNRLEETCGLVKDLLAKSSVKAKELSTARHV